MKFLKLVFVLLAIILILSLAAVSAGYFRRKSAPLRSAVTATESTENSFDPQRYRLDSSQSKFIAHAMAGGLLWFKGHDHLVSIREFSGEAQLTPDQITPASLEISAKSASMGETSSVFTA